MNKPMKWDDITPIHDEDAALDTTFTADINKALERIGSTPDGDLLKKFLIQTMTIGCAPGAPTVRLSEREGERRFARLLFNKLDGTKHGRRNRSSGNRSRSNGGNAD